MNAILPRGLITIGHTDAPNNDRPHNADVLFERSQILHSFWKVHAIRHRVSKDSLDFRCQNLFWRTWGDPRLSKTITSTKLTSLWTSCQQVIDPNSLRKDSNTYSDSTKPPETIDRSVLTSVPISSDERDKISSPGLLPVTSSTAFEVFPDVQGLKSRGISIDESSGSGSNIENKQKPPRPSRPVLLRAGSSNNRTSFGASSGKTKGRPSLNRRKSSQGASQARSGRLGKPPITNSSIPSTGTVGGETGSSVAAISSFKMPSASSWEDEPAIGQPRSSASNSDNETPSELVEPDFRNRFAERVASSTNLAGMNRMKKTGSVVRFADEYLMELSNVKDIESRTLDSPQRTSFSYRDSAASVGSIAVIDEDENSLPGLVRTKSQLSMMIDENRSQQDCSVSEPLRPTSHTGLSSRRRREPTEEEKLLAMAHGEGVTRAGGRSVRRGFKFSDEDESRYSSPSPPPLF